MLKLTKTGIKKNLLEIYISWIQETMHHDKVPLAFGIKIAPHHPIPFTIPRDWHGVLSIRSSLNANQTSY